MYILNAGLLQKHNIRNNNQCMFLYETLRGRSIESYLSSLSSYTILECPYNYIKKYKEWQQVKLKLLLLFFIFLVSGKILD